MKRRLLAGLLMSIIIVQVMMIISCSGGREGSEIFIEPSMSDQVIEIYFFHFFRKCNSCEAIKSVTPSLLQLYFPDEWKAGKIVFRLVNTETDQGKAIARDLGIIGQEVLIFKGELRIEVTQPAFLFANDNPDRYGRILKEEIDKLL